MFKLLSLKCEDNERLRSNEDFDDLLTTLDTLNCEHNADKKIIHSQLWDKEIPHRLRILKNLCPASFSLFVLSCR